MSIPRIAITPGDLAGVGPELCIRIAQQSHPAELVVYSDQQALAERAQNLQLPIRWQSADMSQPAQAHQPGNLKICHIPANAQTSMGKPNPQQAPFLINTLKRAVNDGQAGIHQALVTGPVCKSMLNQGGFSFTGHTEFIAGLTESFPVMMLATHKLKVALATTHLPLADVSAAITKERLIRVIQILHREFQTRFACPQPCILVAGLNPHAGENGYLGREELDVISPTLALLSRQGIQVEGPIPADTIFLPKYIARADVILCMYHDQGLPVLKYSGFHEAINITLGLPIIRTSVDHGTAFDLVGTSNVDIGSMQSAVAMAIEMAQNRA